MLLRRSMVMRGGYDPQWLATQDTWFVTRSWEISALGEDIGEDIVNRRFISEVSTQTPEFINCLRHIARAGASLTARHGRDNPIGTLLNWFGIGVTLIKAGPWANPTTTEDFTVGQTQSTLVSIANNRGERDQMAAGYMKAAAYFMRLPVEVSSSPMPRAKSSLGPSGRHRHLKISCGTCWVKPPYRLRFSRCCHRRRSLPSCLTLSKSC